MLALFVCGVVVASVLYCCCIVGVLFVASVLCRCCVGVLSLLCWCCIVVVSVLCRCCPGVVSVLCSVFISSSFWSRLEASVENVYVVFYGLLYLGAFVEIVSGICRASIWRCALVGYFASL